MRGSLALLEGDPDVRGGLARMLEGAGWRVAICPGPSELLERVSADPETIVVWGANARRPADRTGLSLLRRRAPRARLIVLTASSRMEEFMDAFSFGARACLSRPVADDELLAALDTLAAGEGPAEAPALAGALGRSLASLDRRLARVESDGHRMTDDLRRVLPRIEAERLAATRALRALRAARNHD